ncbi:low molecular weight protein-tyrosine-phosphatase [Brachybacterium sp. UMB0905]|uniref:low molecular weight protein-tyrosine-phosphatase n=1 Tax=Brachybacterium sp. UMB0905 TaxID=2069310 RepID=UPI000C7FCBCD|nr:low molecular weight protein-tyrosine-phosphatase [Brachybacterium sp. UMB0905]PMC74442.1 protein tyrosine phosphatase [Brachybacterium sp. UMB0905]
MTYRIITVCTGNICRSPMAEYALRAALADAGLDEQVEVESVGVSEWEVGNPVDPRAGALLERHGIDASAHRARAMDAEDLRAADLVLALDHDHVGPLQQALGEERAARTLRMVRDFAPGHVEDTGIRDPWYGTEADFELAWDQIDEAIPGILEQVRKDRDREASA